MYGGSLLTSSALFTLLRLDGVTAALLALELVLRTSEGLLVWWFTFTGTAVSATDGGAATVRLGPLLRVCVGSCVLGIVCTVGESCGPVLWSPSESRPPHTFGSLADGFVSKVAFPEVPEVRFRTSVSWVTVER